MKRLILILAVLTITAGGAMGAPTQQNRDDSLILLGISPIGIHIPTFLTQPLTLGVYLGEDVLIGVEGGSFTFSSDDVDPDADETFDGDFSNVGIYLRWFPNTNSFNFLFAVHQRDWTVNFGKLFVLDDGVTTVDLDARLETEATVATVGIGNQWIMDFGLVIGMDWLVLSGNISESFTFDVTSSVADLTDSEQSRYDEDIKEGADFLNDLSGFPGVLIFTIGWAF